MARKPRARRVPEIPWTPEDEDAADRAAEHLRQRWEREADQGIAPLPAPEPRFPPVPHEDDDADHVMDEP